MNFISIYWISCNCRMEILHGLVETHLCIALDISLILKGIVHFNQAHLFPKASIVSFYSKIQKMAVDHGLILIAFEISIQFAWNLINEINSMKNKFISLKKGTFIFVQILPLNSYYGNWKHQFSCFAVKKSRT